MAPAGLSVNHFKIKNVKSALDGWVVDYNTDYPHLSLGYKTPCEFEDLHLAKIP
jgi:transposase InsO family protein